MGGGGVREARNELLRLFCDTPPTLIMGEHMFLLAKEIPMSSSERLIENLRDRMNQMGVSQSELARRIDASPSYVNQILNQRQVPGLNAIDRIAEALETTAENLISKKMKVSA